MTYAEPSERCKSCGSRKFCMRTNGLSCRVCGQIIKTKPVEKIEEFNNLFVVKGPKTIYSQHKAYGFFVPEGKFAIAAVEIDKKGAQIEVSRLPMVLDNESSANSFVKSLKFANLEKPKFSPEVEFEKEGTQEKQDRVFEEGHVIFTCDECLGIFSVNPGKIGCSSNLLGCPRCGNVITR